LVFPASRTDPADPERPASLESGLSSRHLGPGSPFVSRPRIFNAEPLSKVVTSSLQRFASCRFQPTAEAACLPQHVGVAPTFLGPAHTAHTVGATLAKFSGSYRVCRATGSNSWVHCLDRGLQPLGSTFVDFPCGPFALVAKNVGTPLMDFSPSTGLPDSSPGLIRTAPLPGMPSTKHPLMRFSRPSSAHSSKRPPFHS